MSDRRPGTVRSSPENGKFLTPRQEAAAASLAAGFTQAVAAEQSGAGERTIKTWLATVPAIGARVRELRAELTSRALGRLAAEMASAAETLGFLSRKAKSEMCRLGAARAVLELGVKLRESVELEERIAALEVNQPKVPR
jgi:hypothetical protein